MFLKILALKDAYINNEDGATAIEYGLIAAGISIVIAAVVFTIGDDLLATFTGVSDSLNSANAP